MVICVGGSAVCFSFGFVIKMNEEIHGYILLLRKNYFYFTTIGGVGISFKWNIRAVKDGCS